MVFPFFFGISLKRSPYHTIAPTIYLSNLTEQHTPFQVHHLNMALLVWLWWRTSLASALRPIVAALIVGCVYRPLLPQLLTILLGARPSGFTLLSAFAIPTLCTTLIAGHIFITHSSSIRSY